MTSPDQPAQPTLDDLHRPKRVEEFRVVGSMLTAAVRDAAYARELAEAGEHVERRTVTPWKRIAPKSEKEVSDA